jgi:hypothetical protein
MERVTNVKLTPDEKLALRALRLAADRHLGTKEARDAHIVAAVQLGLPVRMVGEAARLSGAAVSRLTSSKAMSS